MSLASVRPDLCEPEEIAREHVVYLGKKDIAPNGRHGIYRGCINLFGLSIVLGKNMDGYLIEKHVRHELTKLLRELKR